MNEPLPSPTVPTCAYTPSTTGKGLFGPVLYYDLVRNTRSARIFVLRCGCLLFVVVVLFLVCSSEWGDARLGFMGLLFHPIAVPARETAKFAERFFKIFMVTQVSLVSFSRPYSRQAPLLTRSNGERLTTC